MIQWGYEHGIGHGKDAARVDDIIGSHTAAAAPKARESGMAGLDVNCKGKAEPTQESECIHGRFFRE